MKILCIDSNNKPKIIPDNEWVEEGKVYSIKSIVNLPLQPTIIGYLLNEISLSPSSFPYEFYSSKRFVILSDKNEVLEEILEEEFTI